MARGKHAASAAKRRAESAEEQLDRLFPQLTDAKRTAARYRSEAEQAAVLRRQLAELRDQVGIPVDQHVAELEAVRVECQEVLDAYDEAINYVVRMLTSEGWIVEDTDRRCLNGQICLALYVLPEQAVEELTKAMGWGREYRRFFPSPAAATRVHEYYNGRRLHGGGLAEVGEGTAQRLRQYMSAKWEMRHEATEATDG